MKRFWKDGDPWIWLTGGTLAVCLIFVAGLVFLITVSGMGIFWPQEILRFTLADGKTVLGSIAQSEPMPKSAKPGSADPGRRIQVKQGNRDQDLNAGVDFVWIDESKITGRDVVPEAVLVERREWGNLFGTIKEVRVDGKPIAQGPEKGLEAILVRMPAARAQADKIESLQKRDIGAVNRSQDRIRLQLKGLALEGTASGPAVDRLQAQMKPLDEQYAQLAQKLTDLRKVKTGTVLFGIEGGKEKELDIENIVRIIEPNRMGLFSKAGCYLSRLWEFLVDDPRESNTEGGVFPAIFGTVMMVLLMSLFVTPLGILAALYLREYAKQGTFV
ncbi:MAG TPA: phosphate ABC transporter, permease protein PstA, partial [Planctomycetota bacterium]|nr:phosphate ABC transporter, permease protein PstA [Planctomycetota bacterium]